MYQKSGDCVIDVYNKESLTNAMTTHTSRTLLISQEYACGNVGHMRQSVSPTNVNDAVSKIARITEEGKHESDGDTRLSINHASAVAI